ncbi:PepSY domain-containing protein [Rhodoferax ferrireducens]|uniref:PepSY domain-containing protein n=1 Tax=Rhodoferax ferrireducens TaxID=192843 RepID=UPI000E0DB150|nr:PepSY domain-containing protein [Rhodoferax ferrireducens]
MKRAHILQGISRRTRSALILSCTALALASVASAENKPQQAVKISEEQAKAIALKKMPGKVTDVAIEKKRGKTVYVVEVMTESQGEKDVFIDMQSGAVVGTD